MDNLATDLFSVLRFLLPGFLAAWIFYGLSAYEKPTQFERVIQALIFTIAVQFCVSIIAIIYFKNFKISENPSLPIHIETIISVLFAIAIGLTFALLANKDWLHNILRKCKITKQTSYPSEWFGTFNTHISYIVLHLKDGRRIYGWPKEWPQTPEKGHFYMVEASWLESDDEKNYSPSEIADGVEIYLPDENVDGLLINIDNVEFVEFMKKGKDHG